MTVLVSAGLYFGTSTTASKHVLGLGADCSRNCCFAVHLSAPNSRWHFKFGVGATSSPHGVHPPPYVSSHDIKSLLMAKPGLSRDVSATLVAATSDAAATKAVGRKCILFVVFSGIGRWSG